MSDPSPRESGKESSADQLMTSWVRISLDYGRLGFEADDAEDETDQQDPNERMRAEIERILGSAEVVKGEGPVHKGSRSSSEGIDLSAQALEEMLTKEIISFEGIPAAERGTGTDSTAEREGQEGVSQDEDTPAVDAAESFSDTDFERRVSEATSDDVVSALRSASIDIPEIMAYEADINHVDIFVLCLSHRGRLLTARPADAGELEPGVDFYDEFTSDLLGRLPVRGGLCSEEDSYTVRAPVTLWGDTVQLDSDSRVAALVEIEVDELLDVLAQVELPGTVEAAPSDRGWSLVSADPVSLLMLLRAAGRPSVVAESTGVNHHLSFILPGGSSAGSQDSGSWGEWIRTVVGDPAPDDSGDGTVIDLVWGAPKVLTRRVEQDSAAADALWDLPGNLPDPFNRVRLGEQVENLIWVYGLDSSEARRLHNYVDDSVSELGMESVLQLLEISDALVKVVLGSLPMDSLDGYRIFEPLGREPGQNNGSRTSVLGGASFRPLHLFGRGRSDSAGKFVASGALASLVVVRRLRGTSAGLAALGSVTFFGLGLVEAARRRCAEGEKDLRGGLQQSSSTTGAPSLMEELRHVAETDDDTDRLGARGRFQRTVHYLRKLAQKFRG